MYKRKTGNNCSTTGIWGHSHQKKAAHGKHRRPLKSILERVLSLFDLLCFHDLLVAAYELYHINAFREIAHVVVLAFGGFEEFHLFTQYIEDYDLAYGIGVVLHGDVFRGRVGIHGKFRTVRRLCTECESGSEEEEDE